MAQEGTYTAFVYTWEIENFTKLISNKLHSDVFVYGGYKWLLVAYADGNSANNYLSLFLEVANSAELPDGWSIDMESLKFSVVVVPPDLLTDVNQFHTKDSSERSTKHRFHAGEPDCCFQKFRPFGILYFYPPTLVVRVLLSVSAEQTPKVLMKSKNLLAELSSMNRTRSSTSSSGTSGSSLPLKPQSVHQHRKALQDYLTLPLEAIVEANAFDDIERIAVILVQHSSNSLEKTILEDLVSRLATFKETLVSTKSNIENVEANRIALSGKSADVGVRLDRGREHLRILEAEFLRLTTQEEELRVRKSSMSVELEKLIGQVSKDLGVWRDINKERVEEDKKWHQTREKLAQANLSWNIFQQNLEQSQLLSSHEVPEKE